MMLNLFSIFDPVSIFNLSLNWMSSILILLMLPQLYWMYYSRIINFFMYLFMMLWNEFKIVMLNKFNVVNLIFFIVLFNFILMNNFMGLFPYIFTSSSHMIFPMTFALSMWLSMMFFGWIKNTKFMLVHLVPQGTPFGLMSFMVLIESLSNLIRPLTLSIRLTANMIAGHLLLTLLSSFIPSYFMLYLFVLIMQLMLLVLEVAVSLIQSYVFVTLLTLYLKETN